MQVATNTPQKQQTGSVLLVSLITCAILGTILASYLTMVQSQSIAVMRSQAWNASIAATEAGIEEALAHLNRNAPFFDLAEATNNLAANYWTQVGNTFHAPRRYLGLRSFYDVSITLQGLQPFINATGYVWMADTYAYAPAYVLAAIGGDEPAPKLQARSVNVETVPDPLFDVAMAAMSTIDFSGNNVSTDSFDSADPNHSENGGYPFTQPAKRKSNGDVCSNATIINSIDVGNANINGKAKTGPNGTVYVGKNGYVSGGIDDDFNVVFPPVTLPQTAWLYAGSGNYTFNGKTYKHAILNSGDYYLVGLSGSLFIGTNARVRLLLTGNTKLTGNSEEIRISPGATLRLFVNAPSFSIKGQGVANHNNNAASFYYFGTTNNTSVSFGGNAAFTGAIYAPQADFSLGGGGNDIYDFIGASVTRTVKMNGHFNFHYDENLRRVGPSRGFVPTRWQET